MKDGGGDGSSTSAPVRCSRAPRASRTTPRPRRACWALPDHGRGRGGVQPIRQAARHRGVLAAPSCAVTLGRHGRAGRLRFSSPGRGRTSLPRASAPCPGVTLSDAGGQGERTRTRRSGAKSESTNLSSEPHPNGRSACRGVSKPTAGSRVQSLQRVHAGVRGSGTKGECRRSDNGPYGVFT
jgi:hypothetical protein